MAKRRKKARKACVRAAKKVVCGTLVKAPKKARKRRRKARK